MKTRQKIWGVLGYVKPLNREEIWNQLLLLGICIFLTFGCASDDNTIDLGPPQSSSTGSKINGSVKDALGNAYPDTSIEISGGADNQERKTGSNGEYSFNTKGTGLYQVDLTLPLKSNLTTATPVFVDVKDSATETVNFVIEPEPVDADLIVGNVDILGELKNASGSAPSGSEMIYAANVWDPPFGQLTAVLAPDGHHFNLTEWKQANGELNVNCNGNKANVEINMQGLIPDGTYTFWLNFLNKKKSVGQIVNFQSDVVGVQPLGASSGIENVAIADNEGSINVSIQHDSCILTKETGLVMVVIYHINGNTFGSAHIPDAEEISQLLFYFQ